MSEPCQLYRHYAEDNSLLYIGIAYNALGRTGQHSKKPWAKHVAHIEIVTYPTRERAKRAEAFAIGNELPAFNRRLRGDAPMSALECGRGMGHTLAKAYALARRGVRMNTVDPIEFADMPRQKRREHRRMWKRLARIHGRDL